MMIRCELAYNDTVGLFYLRGGPNGMASKRQNDHIRIECRAAAKWQTSCFGPSKDRIADWLSANHNLHDDVSMEMSVMLSHYHRTAVFGQITEPSSNMREMPLRRLGAIIAYVRDADLERSANINSNGMNVRLKRTWHHRYSLYIFAHMGENRKWVINLFDLRCRLFCAIVGRFEWVHFSHMQARPIALCRCADGNHGARRMWQKQHTSMANNKQQKIIRISLLYSQFYFSAAFMSMASTDKRAKIFTNVCRHNCLEPNGQWAMLAT